MRCGAPRGDQLISDASRKGQVRKRSVEMTQLSTTVPEFNFPEAVFTRRDTFPAPHGGAHRLDGGAWR